MHFFPKTIKTQTEKAFKAWISQETRINFQHNRNEDPTEKRTSNPSKNLNPEYLEYFSLNPVGSGSYGQCFCAGYGGIQDALAVPAIRRFFLEREKEKK